MRGEFRERGVIIPDNQARDEQENADLLKTEWWKEISTDKIPYCPRPKGGKRIDFFAYSNFPDMALEIKESYYGFKHTGDVHRTAHYIGMYILREKHVKNKTEQPLDGFMVATKEIMHRGVERKRMQEDFMVCFDQCIDGLMTAEELDGVRKKMGASIKDDDAKKWFESMTNSVMNDDTEVNKSKNRQRMREVRAKMAGLRLVENRDREAVGE
jgi:hypothetical protein